MNDPVSITGVWLRSTADILDELEVWVEVVEEGGSRVWHRAITELREGGPISHIAEPSGILSGPRYEKGRMA